MIIATAGHVDHGKTSLVKALTGTDTDRLPEEKKRGLTIELGFAYLDAGSGQPLAFIDVPGHEKFVRNAIAGVGLADVAILVIAADDGPMPQTLEHLSILNLLGIQKIVPVITKVDLVDAQVLAETKDRVAELLHDAPFKSEMFLVSISDQESISRLKQKIISLQADIEIRRQSGNFRMAIDRCFTLEGSGTIVTGTVAAGEVNTDDAITLISNNADSGKSARIRSLHTQNTKAQRAQAGQRCALNVTGELNRSALERGSWLVGDKNFESTSQLDVIIQLAPHRAGQVLKSEDQKHKLESRGHLKVRPLKHWTPAHLHIGTADIPCRIALLEVSQLEQGERSFARLICEKSVAGVNGDRFILRDQSARYTIAGGTVLDPFPPRRGRSKPQRLQQLRAVDEESPKQALANLLEHSDVGVNLAEFARRFDLPSAELNAIYKELDLSVIAAGNETWGLSVEQLKHQKESIVDSLQQFHLDKSDQLGVDVTLIGSLLGTQLKTQVLEYCLGDLQRDEKVLRTGSVYSLPGHEVVLSKEDQRCWEIIKDLLDNAKLVPSRVTEIAEALNKTADETVLLLNRCMSHGKLYKVTDNRYFLPQTLKQLASIAAGLSEKDSLTVAEFRNQSGVGRNLVVELLEYFDRIRFTQRIDDKRQLLVRVEDKF